MKKTNLILLSLVMVSSMPQAAEYNFYFYDNEKPKTEEELTDQKIKELKAPNNTTSLSDSLNLRSVFGEGSYISLGTGYESYLPGTQLSYFVRVKFLPLVTLEAAMKDTFMNYGNQDIYRFSALLEGKLTNFLWVNINGGTIVDSPDLHHFAGGGARLKLFKHIDLVASVGKFVQRSLHATNADLSSWKAKTGNLRNASDYFVTGGISIAFF